VQAEVRAAYTLVRVQLLVPFVREAALVAAEAAAAASGRESPAFGASGVPTSASTNTNTTNTNNTTNNTTAAPAPATKLAEVTWFLVSRALRQST
jgi:hypothetical protein